MTRMWQVWWMGAHGSRGWVVARIMTRATGLFSTSGVGGELGIDTLFVVFRADPLNRIAFYRLRLLLVYYGLRRNTRICARVLNKGPMGVASPVDTL